MSDYTPQFLAPQGRGRPPVLNDLTSPITSFLDGVDFAFDTLTGNGICSFAINNRCEHGRTLDKRMGRELFGALGGNGKVLMQNVLNITTGTDIPLRIITSGTQVQLQKYAFSPTNDWVNVGGVFGNASNQVSFYGANIIINGQPRFYFTNGIDQMRYTEGTTVVTVTDGATSIYGKFTAAVENILVLGNLGAPFGAHQAVYSKAGTDQFRRDVDLAYADSSQVITLDGEITQTVTFGSFVYLFTKDHGVWEVDLNTGIPRQITTTGTVSPKSVAVNKDIMMWADQYSVWGMPLNGRPERLGEPIENFYYNADFANIEDFNATITPDGQYKLWIGDVTYKGETFSNVVLIYEIEQSRSVNALIWRIDTNIPASCWGIWSDTNGFKDSYMGSRESASTYLMDTGYSDAGEDITLDWRSKDITITGKKQEYHSTDNYILIEPHDTQPLAVDFYARAMIGSTGAAWEKYYTLTVPSESGTDVIEARIPVGQNAISGKTLAHRIVVSNQLPFRMYEMEESHEINDTDIPYS